MPVAPHKVIASFKYAGAQFDPPVTWTPPTPEIAAKLIAKGCLQPLQVSVQESPPAQAQEVPVVPPQELPAEPDGAPPTEQAEEPEPGEAPPQGSGGRRGGRRGRRGG